MTMENLTADQRILIQQIIDNIPPNIKDAARQAHMAHQCYYAAMVAKYPDTVKTNPGVPLYNAAVLSPLERRELAELTMQANMTYSELDLRAAEAAQKLKADTDPSSGVSLASMAALEVVGSEDPQCTPPQQRKTRDLAMGETLRPRSPGMSA
jgi:hypothetical protein